MAEPLPPVEHAADAMKRADAAIAALKRQKPTTDIAARARSCDLMRLNQILIDASKRVVDASAAKRLNGSNGAKPVQGEATSLSDELITALAKGLVPFLREQILAAVTPLQERIVELEATALRDADVWKPEKVFRPNDLTTYRGGLWRAREPNSNVRPGTSKTWRLMHKTESGGRDDPR